MIFPDLQNRRKYQQDIKVAVVLRLVDGAQQYSVLRPVVGRYHVQPYGLLGSALRTLDYSSRLPFLTLEELPDDVFLFVSGQLETLNHFFLEELVRQVTRADCGLVSGISLDLRGRILHAGFQTGDAGQRTDRFAGQLFSSVRDPDLNAVRSVQSISELFFAIRREHLADAGGLSVLHASQMQAFADRLADNATAQGLAVLVTPDAVATFECCNLDTASFGLTFGSLPASTQISEESSRHE